MRWSSHGFSGAQPRPPARLVERPDRREVLVGALCSRERLVAVTGVGGAGKSTLVAQACATRQVQRAFRDGIAWLEAGPGKQPVVLLADLAARLGLPRSATGFGTDEQGREQLTVALRGRRVVIVVDDVREAGQVEALVGLAPRCTVLFTTRLDKLAHQTKAKEVAVGELTSDQALELLGHWTDQAPEALPYGARDVCTQAGNLALGVALAGGMAAGDMPFTKVLAAIKEDPAEGADPGSEEQPLFGVIEASIDDLPEADQGHYAQLAVFAGRGPFPRDAARALWPPELPDAEVDELLARLTARNLLTMADEGWYAAHSLQYDALALRLGAAGLTAAHAQLLNGYRRRYPDGWADSVTDPYLGRTLASHLHDANLGDELRALLTDPAWIEARLTHGPLPVLISDYRYARDPLTRQILRALRMSAPVLAADPAQVRGQLADRLKGQPDLGITAWAAGLTGQANRPAPQVASLTVAHVANPPDQALIGHTDQVRAVAVTLDGKHAVSGSDDGTLRIWDLDTRRQEAVLTGHTDWVRAVAVTADGKRAVSASDDGSLRIWDLDARREQATLTGHTGEVFSVAITPDGKRAVSGGSDGSVRVWDLDAGREETVLIGHGRRPAWSVAITADGTRAVSGGGDWAVRIWDLAASQQQATLKGHTGEVFSVAITPDGKRAVSGGGGGSVRVWDLDARREEAVLTGHSGWVRTVAITPDGSRAVSGGEDGSVRVWDLDAQREQATRTGHTRQVLSAAVTVDGERAVTGSDDGSVRIWDLTTSRSEAVPATAGEPAAPADLEPAPAPDGEPADAGQPAVPDAAPPAASEPAPTASEPAPAGSEPAPASSEPAPASSESAPAASEPAGKPAAEVGGWTFSVALTPDGTRAVTGSDDGSVRIWDLATGQPRAILTGHTRPAWSVAITPDGKRAVSGSSDGSVRVWDLAAGRELASLTDRDHQVFSVAITPDGTRAVSGSGNVLQVWDLASRRVRATLTGHTGEVFSVTVSPDGKRAVSGSSDGSVRVWNLASRREEAVLLGHDRQVFAVAIAPDKTVAVSGGEDGSVRVWDLATRTEIARWTGNHPIIGCAVIPGRTLRIGVGLRQGSPFLLELLDVQGSDTGDQRSEQPGDKQKAGIRWRPWSPDPAATTTGVQGGQVAI